MIAHRQGLPSFACFALSAMLATPASADDDLASVTALGGGTSGSAGQPTLNTTAAPSVGQPAFDLRISGAAPNSIATVLVGTSAAPTSLSAFGATLWPAAPFASLGVFVDGTGTSSQFAQNMSALPASAIGVELIAQAAIVDAGAQGGLAFTDGIAIALGVGPDASALFAHAIVRRPTGFVDAAVGDVDGDGLSDIVTVGGSGLITTLRRADGSLVERAPITSNLVATGVALADVNGDGMLDALVTGTVDDFLTERLVVRPAVGDGVFGEPSFTATIGDKVDAFVVVDTNLDGELDVVLQRDHVLVTLLGNGDATFGGLITSAIPMESAPFLEAADLNGDGFADLVNDRHAIVGAGDGTFTQSQFLPFDGLSFGNVAIGDVDGDLIPDLVGTSFGILTAEGRTYVSMFKGLGDGTFAEPVAIDEPSLDGITRLDLGDLDRDGLLDIVTSAFAPFVFELNRPSLQIRTGLGGGNFADPVRLNVLAITPHLMDVDGDDDLDVVGVSNAGIVVRENLDDGAFDDGATQLIGTDGAAPIDVDHDGIPDLIAGVAEGQMRWGRGVGDGTFVVQPPIEIDVRFGSILTVADFDGDGDEDVLTFTNQTSVVPAMVQVLVSVGAAAFEVLGTPLVVNFHSVEVGDLDGDGNADVVLTEQITPFALGVEGVFALRVFLTSGGGFDELPVVRIRAWGEIELGDVDGDGVLDLATRSIDSIDVRLGLGDGTFGTSIVTPTAADLGRIRFADFNGDNILDGVIAGGPSKHFTTALGVGDGTFGDIHVSDLPSNAFFAEAVDVNGDGAIDVVCDQRDAGGFCVSLGFGDGTFTDARGFAPATLTFGVRTADFNGDDRLDVLVGSLVDGSLLDGLEFGQEILLQAASPAPEPASEH